MRDKKGRFIKGSIPWTKLNKKGRYKTCKVCCDIFYVRPSGNNKFCSQTCYKKQRLGKKSTWDISYLIGNQFAKGNKPNQTSFQKREHAFKGSKNEYRALHKRITRKKGKPIKCIHCNFESKESRKIHWANKSHKYIENLNDWIALCASCHFKYDN